MLNHKSYKEAPNIVGIAIINEYLVAILLLSPDSIPPITVAPNLDTPGIMEMHCAKPTHKDCLIEILYKSE